MASSLSPSVFNLLELFVMGDNGWISSATGSDSPQSAGQQVSMVQFVKPGIYCCRTPKPQIVTVKTFHNIFGLYRPSHVI